MLGDTLTVSIATEFIENEKEDIKKQDCERKAFKRLATKIKRDYPRLPICILGDSLYACAPVFQICKENRWAYLIRYKDGSIRSLAKEFHTIINKECKVIHKCSFRYIWGLFNKFTFQSWPWLQRLAILERVRLPFFYIFPCSCNRIDFS